MSTKSLLSTTYQLIDESGLTYREIAGGAGVDINWVAKLAQRAIGEPGVTKVQAVHDYLSALKKRNRVKASAHAA